MKFPYLLFDADDTLFDFPKAAARAFSAMCRSNGVPDTLDTRALYHRINQELWAAFDRGEVSKDYVTLERFVRFFQALKLPRDPDKCNRDYLTALGAGVYPLPHAEAVCRELVRRGHKLYIVTNAVASVQRSRLQGSVFADLITDAFISEDAGASKPDPAYYAYVRSRIPGLTPENGLVIGDSLSTDIRGANNAGLPCCWYNPAGKARPEDLRIDYEIRDLRELAEGREITRVIVDPSAASFIEALRREGFRVVRADNDVADGIRVTADLLKRRRIVICGACADCLREMETYCWDDKGRRDAPKKEQDHAMDDLRYFAMDLAAEEQNGFAATWVERRA